MNMGHKRIVIIGNGISGITAARFIRKMSNHRIVVISKETDHFFSRTALMYIYMGHMKYEHTKPYEDFFWEKNRIELIRGSVKSIDFQRQTIFFDPSFKVSSPYSAPENLSYDKLIIASGSKSRFYNWPGQDLDGVCGLYSIQDLKYMEKYTTEIQRAVVVGGGLIGVELAEMLNSRKIPTTLLVREQEFYNSVFPLEEAGMISGQIRKHGIDLRLNTELKAIKGDAKNRCKEVVSSRDETIRCDFVALATGVQPNVEFLNNTTLELDEGILVDDYLKTNIENVYAIGDCAQLKNPAAGRKAIEPVWYTGRIMGETVAHTICGLAEKYSPGIWFNSAKFFDIEYQVYGQVDPQPNDKIGSLFWKSNSREQSIRINYRKSDQSVIGFNLLGVRFRQEVCEKWIREHCTLEEVLSAIGTAVFDAEFSADVEGELIKHYEKSSGKKLPLKRKRGWDTAFHFLKQTK